jgi:hypothetical protein
MEIVLGLAAAVICLAIWVLWSAQSTHERFMKELDMAIPPEPTPTPTPTPSPTPTPTPSNPKRP